MAVKFDVNRKRCSVEKRPAFGECFYWSDFERYSVKDVPPGSPNPDPISDQKIVIFYLASKFILVFRPGIGRNYVTIT